MGALKEWLGHGRCIFDLYGDTEICDRLDDAPGTPGTFGVTTLKQLLDVPIFRLAHHFVDANAI